MNATDLADATGITTDAADRILAHFDDVNTESTQLFGLLDDSTSTEEQITAAVNRRTANLNTARTAAREAGLPEGDIARLANNAWTGTL